jgi:flagellar biosynthesis/type III secretory pathway protein FliH
MDGFSPLHIPGDDGFQAWDLEGSGDGFEALGPWGVRSDVEVPVPPSEEPDLAVVSAVFPAVTAPEPTPEVKDVDVEAFTKAAYDEAFAQGLADGQRKAQELAGEVEDLLLQLQGMRAEFFNQSVRDVTDSILHIARSVVRRELSFDSRGVEDLVIAILEDTAQGDEVVIRLAPEDDRAMKEAYPRLLEALGRDGTFRVELDGALHPGGAIVETSYGSIDGSVETQMAAFAESVEAWAEGEVDLVDE